ncbi:MAG: FecR domain-containing protein [Armatimonadetes bacterium]|nr:FecR domain-containing protein [Armatimonadota bacterium]MDW8028380.1 FecR domain-containing protein [Armatimonadota bacterium]
MRWLWSFLVLGLLVGVGWAQQARISAIVRVVEHQRAGTIQWLASKVGTPLENGDRVRTGKRSYAEVTFADKSVVKLNERSELTIASAAEGKQDMELNQGSLWARFVKGSQATIRAKTTVAAVRGTEIIIAISPDGSVLIRVLEGELVIILPTGQTLTLIEGQQVIISPDPTAPPPTPSPAPSPQYGVDPTITDFSFVERIAVPGVIYVTPGAQDFNELIRTDPAQSATNPTVSPEVPGGLPTVQPPATGGLEVVVRSRQFAMEATGLALTSDRRPRTLYGLRLRPTGTSGPFFFAAAWQPVNIAGTTRSRWTEAYIAYKDQQIGTFRFGRQWITQSPVTATLVGKLLISDIADGISWQKTFGKTQVTLAYLYDGQPDLNKFFGRPFDRRRQGVYLRLSQPILGGIIGISAMKVRGGTTGYALDFSQPVIPNQLDFYGEIGRKSLQRSNFYTFGLYFPGLYQRFGTDLFIEYTKAPRNLPDFFSVRLFQTILPNMTLVIVGARRGDEAPNGSGIDWTVGLAYKTSLTLK